MNSSELLGAYLSAGQNIDSLWNFFISVHLAICGVIIYSGEMYKRYLLPLSIAYFAFSIINLRAKFHDYSLYSSIVEALRSLCVDLKGCQGSNSVLMFFAGYEPDDRFVICVLAHIFSAVFLLLLLVMKNRGAKITKN